MRDLTREQIMSYIPKSKREAVDDAYTDQDGIWIHLTDNYEATRMGGMCHIIHEDTIKQLRYQIAGIRRVK